MNSLYPFLGLGIGILVLVFELIHQSKVNGQLREKLNQALSDIDFLNRQIKAKESIYEQYRQRLANIDNGKYNFIELPSEGTSH